MLDPHGRACIFRLTCPCRRFNRFPVQNYANVLQFCFLSNREAFVSITRHPSFPSARSRAYLLKESLSKKLLKEPLTLLGIECCDQPSAAGKTVSSRVEPLHILGIDCCEHILEALQRGTSSRLTSISVGMKESPRPIEKHGPVDLIVIGVSTYPVRRIFISQIRSTYPTAPMLILRRVDGANGEMIGGEFILGHGGETSDLEIVSAVRRILPVNHCNHTPRAFNYDLVRSIMQVIAEKYPDPHLNLQKVARALSISPQQLSRILNQSVGVTFRQLLRTTRIEEAKRLLAHQGYSVKEVAALVGFANRHYFSRSFKDLTGESAGQYRSKDVIFGQ